MTSRVTGRVTSRRGALALDLLAVAAFVLIGRSSHGEGEGLAGVLRTLWPFAVGLGVGWLVVLGRGWTAVAVRTGLLLGPVTAWLGLVLRALSEQGVAFSFAIVATVFLTLFLVGWRGFARILRR